jgi:hypothetical protein
MHMYNILSIGKAIMFITPCLCWEELCVFNFWDKADWKQVVVGDIAFISTKNHLLHRIMTQYKPTIKYIVVFFLAPLT